MPKLIGMYEYRFVRPDYVGDPGCPWEHIGIVMQREAPGGPNLTMEQIANATDIFAKRMAENAARWDRAAEECMASSHTRQWATRKVGETKRCRDIAGDQHWCVLRAQANRDCTRTAERTMLIRIDITKTLTQEEWPR